MTTLPSWFLPLIGVTVAILVALFGYVINLSREVSKIQGERAITCVEHGRLLGCLPEMKKQIEKLVADNERSWSVLDKYLASVIHSPVHRDRDELMDRFKEGRLTEAEIERIKPMLEAFIKTETDSDKKLAGALAIMRLETIKPISED